MIAINQITVADFNNLTDDNIPLTWIGQLNHKLEDSKDKVLRREHVHVWFNIEKYYRDAIIFGIVDMFIKHLNEQSYECTIYNVANTNVKWCCSMLFSSFTYILCSRINCHKWWDNPQEFYVVVKNINFWDKSCYKDCVGLCGAGGLCGPLCCCVGLCTWGCVWLCVAVSSHVELWRAIWSCVEPYGALWIRMELCGAGWGCVIICRLLYVWNCKPM